MSENSGTPFTILHISDLHRNQDGKVNNDQLFASLNLDFDRYSDSSQEGLSKPEIIIVSGDLIYGSNEQDEIKAKNEIRQQYKEADEFLNLLTLEYLDNDKDRIIIIPGNHDVQWKRSKESMVKIDQSSKNPNELKELSFKSADPNSTIRWSWSDLNFYEIKNEEIYNRRFELFSNFYKNFYDGKRSFSLNPSEQYDIFDLPNYNITIVGYNSCFRNDHLNKSGLINSACLADSVNKLRTYKSQGRLLFAVWHHNFSGIPSDSTYLDPRQIKTLNTYGYSIGFHGHQHLSDIVENYILFDNSRKLITISAGTLCSARPHLPTGYKRQYNLLKVDYDKQYCHLYSREMFGNMQDIPLWDKGRINESLQSNMELSVTFPAKSKEIRIDEKIIDELNIYLKSNQYEKILNRIKTLPPSTNLVRSILLEVDNNTSGFREEICAFLREPKNFQETILFLENSLDQSNTDLGQKLLNDAQEMFKFDATLLLELKKYNLRLNGYK